MSKEYFCDLDSFYVVMKQLVDDVAADVDGATLPVVKSACKKAKKEIKSQASGKIGKGKYAGEFAYTVSKRGLESWGEVGNPKRPGLVHLLEKGHAKVGGGRVAGRPHMAPAYDASSEYFWQEAQKMLEEVL